MKKLTLALMGCLTITCNAVAVWPPSTAFQEEIPATFYGSLVMVFVIGVVVGVWAQRNRNEHK